MQVKIPWQYLPFLVWLCDSSRLLLYSLAPFLSFHSFYFCSKNSYSSMLCLLLDLLIDACSRCFSFYKAINYFLCSFSLFFFLTASFYFWSSILFNEVEADPLSIMFLLEFSWLTWFWRRVSWYEVLGAYYGFLNIIIYNIKNKRSI